MIDPHRLPAVDVLAAHDRLAVDGGTTGDPGPILVDVREPNEFVEVRAPGAMLFPLSTFVQRFRELPQDRPLLMICRSGARSGQATAFLLGNGWPDVANVSGGMLAWERAGLPIESGEPSAGG